MVDTSITWPSRFKQTFQTYPLEMRNSTTDSLELSIALIRGVPPLIVCASISAPCSRSNWTRSICPEWQAWCSAVHLKLSRALISALENENQSKERHQKSFTGARKSFTYLVQQNIKNNASLNNQQWKSFHIRIKFRHKMKLPMLFRILNLIAAMTLLAIV